jgi:histidyl-tRNA synthetase
MVGNTISELNLVKLESLQKVILAEEDKKVSVDDTLSRVLDFYNKFVPYQ